MAHWLDNVHVNMIF